MHSSRWSLWLAMGLLAAAAESRAQEHWLPKDIQRCNYCTLSSKPLADVQSALRKLRKGPPYLPAVHHSRWGYINADVKMVTPPQYDRTTRFSGGLAAVKVTGEWARTKDGIRVAGTPEHHTAPAVPDGKAVSGKWGYVDEDLEFVIAPVYEEAGPFSDGRAFVTRDGKAGYIDTTGRMVIREEVPARKAGFSEGMALVLRDGKWGFMDVSGKVVIEPAFSEAWAFSDGVSRVRTEDGRHGFINKSGKKAFAAMYEEARDFGEKRAAVKIDGKWGYIDPRGKTVIKPRFDYAGVFSEGLAAVAVDWKFGYIDPKGKIVIEPQFGWGGAFSEGLALVDRPDGSRLFIEKKGEVAIKVAQFDIVDYFHDGFAVIGVGAGDRAHAGYIDKAGKEVWSHSAFYK